MSDRPQQIADAAIAIIAGSGVRALTHRAVDRELGLPNGSTSYYFRSKRALIEATVRQLTQRSRDHFEEATAAPGPATADAAARLSGEILDRLLDERIDDVRARYALTIELAGDTELHRLLAGSLFSRTRAVALLAELGAADPTTAGADFVSVVEGVVFDRFAGARSLDGVKAGTPASVEQLAGVFGAYLRGVTADC